VGDVVKVLALVLGGLLLASPIIGQFVWIARVESLKVAAAIFGCVFGTVAVVAGGAVLLVWSLS
jgi:hypothetical protein